MGAAVALAGFLPGPLLLLVSSWEALGLTSGLWRQLI